MSTPPEWLEAQQKFWRKWRSGLDEDGSKALPFGDLGGLWRQFGINSESGDSDPVSLWLNQSLQSLLKNAAGEKGSPLGAWSDIFRSPLSLWPFSFSDTADRDSVADWQAKPASAFLKLQDLPPLGLSREWEIGLRDVRQAHAEEQKAAQALARQLSPIVQIAIKRFFTALNTSEGEQDEITSLRELYDLWISIAEQAYAEKVMTKQYSQAFGHYINASARLRKASQKIASDLAEAMNLPNRRELDAIISRQHRLEAEVRALGKPAVHTTDYTDLEFRIEALSQRLDGVAAASNKKSVADLATKSQHSKGKVKSGGNSESTKPKPIGSKRRRKPRLDRSEEFDVSSFSLPNEKPKP